MILVTYEPMEGVSVDVQDHARWTGTTLETGTHGEMISSDLHGAEEPTRWMLRPQQGAETGHSVCTRDEHNVPPEAVEQTCT
jgi:hypothetical protein